MEDNLIKLKQSKSKNEQNLSKQIADLELEIRN